MDRLLPGALKEGFAARLRDARLKRGFKVQPELARASGINKANIKKHEQGVAWPRIPDLYKYCNTLGVPPGYLLWADTSGLSRDSYELFIVAPTPEAPPEDESSVPVRSTIRVRRNLNRKAVVNDR